jgi:predicted NUDIX family NTP pyrophosphohydrolase
MAVKSAGLLLFRKAQGTVEVLLVHPGGPLWARKDRGAWSIPKGEICDDEDPLRAAIREFTEETGAAAPRNGFIALAPQRQVSGKVVHAWAVRADFDPAQLKSSTFSMEWPPHSGRHQIFPEVDRAEWFPVSVARNKITHGQRPFFDELVRKLRQRRL